MRIAGHLKTGFFNKIDVKRSFRVALRMTQLGGRFAPLDAISLKPRFAAVNAARLGLDALAAHSANIGVHEISGETECDADHSGFVSLLIVQLDLGF
jgi:hypothetical protein